MNTVERILIPAPPELIWDFVSNIENIPLWQSNCRGISYLTSVKQGRGVRWRKIALSGRDQVWETTAWYEGIGFEYRIVDGVSYKSNLGRIRIQDTPDGVIVQWTYMYDPGGIIGGLRNTLSLKRSVENEVVDGLWALWREVTALSKEQQDNYIAKSLMRDAPDAESRANYRPRHPSTLHEHSESHVDQYSSHRAIIEEPPIAPDDTRPRPAVIAEENFSADNIKEPDFLSEIPDTDPGTVRATQDLQSYLEETSDIEPIPEMFLPSEVTKIDRVQSPLQNTAFEAEEREIPQKERLSEQSASTTIGAKDTGEVSVFDLFGVKRPTEENEILSLPPQELYPIAEKQTQAPQATIVIREDEDIRSIHRIGLRIRMRRNLINIRPVK